ncbi:MAG TPA: hypothetical protein VMN99_14635 [Anaerolineales bacterium]|nr:hypothetical protein [Anaerolineales bacterium]
MRSTTFASGDDIVSGIVQAANVQATTIGRDTKAEGVLPGNQRIPGDHFEVHDRVRAVVLVVKDRIYDFRRPIVNEVLKFINNDALFPLSNRASFGEK